MVTGLSQSSTSKFSRNVQKFRSTNWWDVFSVKWLKLKFCFVHVVQVKSHYVAVTRTPQIQWPMPLPNEVYHHPLWGSGKVPERSFRAVTQTSFKGGFLLLFWCTANCRLVLRLSPSIWPHLVLKLVRNSGFILQQASEIPGRKSWWQLQPGTESYEALLKNGKPETYGWEYR